MKAFEDKVKFGFSDSDNGNLDFRFDNQDIVNKRRREFFKSSKIDPSFSVVMTAAHGNNYFKISNKDAGKGVTSPENQYFGDILLTKTKGLNLMLLVADCIALVLLDKKNETLAMIHVGSKNLAIGTVGKAIDKMNKVSRNGSEIYAVTSPFIKKCCYEFDKIPEHLKPLEKYFIPSSCHPERSGAESKDPLTMRERDSSSKVGMTECYHLDTEAALKDQLLDGGIKEENMSISQLCSMHDGYPSHRRSQKEALGESRMLVYARML